MEMYFTVLKCSHSSCWFKATPCPEKLESLLCLAASICLIATWTSCCDFSYITHVISESWCAFLISSNVYIYCMHYKVPRFGLPSQDFTFLLPLPTSKFFFTFPFSPITSSLQWLSIRRESGPGYGSKPLFACRCSLRLSRAPCCGWSPAQLSQFKVVQPSLLLLGTAITSFTKDAGR